MFWRRKTGDRPSNPFVGLRNQALSSTADLAGWTTPPARRHVYGGMLDWGLDRGTATLFALDDGTASLYLSSGGGVLGGGFHDSVRDSARAFIASFEPFLDRMDPDGEGATPPGGSTDLRALTLTGRLYVRIPNSEFIGPPQHPMAVVFEAGQALITQLRMVATRPT